MRKGEKRPILIVTPCEVGIFYTSYFTVVSGDVAVPKASNQNVETANAPEDEYGAKDYRALVSLKDDHDARALWVVRGRS